MNTALATNGRSGRSLHRNCSAPPSTGTMWHPRHSSSTSSKSSPLSSQSLTTTPAPPPPPRPAMGLLGIGAKGCPLVRTSLPNPGQWDVSICARSFGLALPGLPRIAKPWRHNCVSCRRSCLVDEPVCVPTVTFVLDALRRPRGSPIKCADVGPVTLRRRCHLCGQHTSHFSW